MLLDLAEMEAFVLRDEELPDQALCFIRDIVAIRDLEMQLADGFRVVLCLLRCFEGKYTEQHFHQKDSETPAVSSEVIFVAFDHLIRVVAWCACSSLEAVWSHLDCEAEIAEEDLPVVVDHDVFWLDVSMQYSLLMASSKCN